jgi:peroxiredoxin
MAQLRQEYDKFTAQDTEVIVVGPDNESAFSNYWQKHNLPFIGLPDPKHTVLRDCLITSPQSHQDAKPLSFLPLSLRDFVP